MRPHALFLALLLLAAPAHAILPRLRADQPVSPAVFGGTLRPIAAAAVAHDGTDFFVISETKGYLAGTRVSPSGAALGPSIRIAELLTPATPSCAVVYTGSHYLVAFNNGDGINVIRVSREGQLLDAPHVVATIGHIAMAWNGRNILLVSGNTRYRMLDRDGNPTNIEQPLTGGITSSISVASNGDGFLVAGIVGLGSSDIRAKFYDANGNPGLTLTLPTTGTGSPIGLSVASDGHDYLVGIETTKEAQSVLVRSDGFTGAPVLLDGNLARTIHVVWNGSEYIAIWARIIFGSPTTLEIAGVRVSASGAPLDAQPVTIRNRSEEIFAASTTALDTFIVAEDYDSKLASGTLFRSLASISNPLVPILNTPRDQTAPAIATNGVWSLMVWREGGAVLGALIDPSGAVSPPIEIASDSQEESQPAVASNGRDFIVFWEAHSMDILARRIGAGRSILDATPIVAGRAGTEATIAAAWSGRAYTAVWTSDSGAVAAAAVSDSGIAEPSIQLKEPGGFADRPAIACDAAGCTAAWDATGGIASAPLTSEGKSAGQAWTVVTEPSTTNPAVLRNGGSRIFFSHQSRIHFATTNPVSLNDPATIFVQSTGSGPRVITTQRDGVYWTESSFPTTRLWFARPGADGTPSGTIDIDVISPGALIASAQRLFVVFSETEPTLGGERLTLRTLAAPDPQPLMPRRRAVR